MVCLNFLLLTFIAQSCNCFNVMGSAYCKMLWFKQPTFTNLNKSCPKLCSTLVPSSFKSGRKAKMITQNVANIQVISRWWLLSFGAAVSKLQFLQKANCPYTLSCLQKLQGFGYQSQIKFRQFMCNFLCGYCTYLLVRNNWNSSNIDRLCRA